MRKVKKFIGEIFGLALILTNQDPPQIQFVDPFYAVALWVW